MAECPDKAALVAYFFGDDSTDRRKSMDAHVATCRACTDELASFRSVEETLSVWTAPAVDQRFDRWRSVPGPAVAADRDGSGRRSFWSTGSPAPAWGLAAVATLALVIGAAAAAVNGFELRYGEFAVSVGRPAIPEVAATELALGDGLQLDAQRTAAPAGPAMMGKLGASQELAQRETDIVLSPPIDSSGSGLEFTLVNSSPIVGRRDENASDRLLVFGPGSPEALLEEIWRRMDGRALPPQPGWSDIAQRFRLAQERDPARVREDFADFIVRVAGRPGDTQPVVAIPTR